MTSDELDSTRKSKRASMLLERGDVRADGGLFRSAAKTVRFRLLVVASNYPYLDNASTSSTGGNICAKYLVVPVKTRVNYCYGGRHEALGSCAVLVRDVPFLHFERSRM